MRRSQTNGVPPLYTAIEAEREEVAQYLLSFLDNAKAKDTNLRNFLKNHSVKILNYAFIKLNNNPDSTAIQNIMQQLLTTLFNCDTKLLKRAPCSSEEKRRNGEGGLNSLLQDKTDQPKDFLQTCLQKARKSELEPSQLAKRFVGDLIHSFRSEPSAHNGPGVSP